MTKKPLLSDYLPQLRTLRIHRFVSGESILGYGSQVVAAAADLYGDQIKAGLQNLPADTSLKGLSWQDYCIQPPRLPSENSEEEHSFWQLQFPCRAAYALHAHGLCLPYAGELLIVQTLTGVYAEVQSRFYPAYRYFDKLVWRLDIWYSDRSKVR